MTNAKEQIEKGIEWFFDLLNDEERAALKKKIDSFYARHGSLNRPWLGDPNSVGQNGERGDL